MNAIVNTKLILENGVIWDGALTYEGDRIVECGKASEVRIPADANLIDARGLYTAPGFVDVHNHGGNGAFFYDDPENVAKYFLSHGQTTVLATVYFNLDQAQMVDAMRKLKAASASGCARIIKGLYMEGPYMNPRYGADSKNIKWRGPISPDEFTEVVDAAGDFVKVWCIAPERENIEDFIKYAKKVNPSVVFSIGHSEATSETILRLKKYGLRNHTHHTDGGQAPGTFPGLKGAGPDEACLYDEDLYAELICDYAALHVRPFMLRMVAKIKGVEKTILITDCTPFAGTNRTKEQYGPDVCYDSDGLLAGSKLTMDLACRNMMMHTGYGLCHVVKFATANPAKMAGLFDDVGSLEPGKKANIIIIDDMVNVKKVIFEGAEAPEDQ